MSTAQKFITEANKQQVIRLLNWTEIQYCEYQQQKGIEYLKHILEVDEYGIQMQISNQLFWRWWVNHWNRRDEEFLTYGAFAPERMRENLYNDLHDPFGFEFYPHSVIMEAGYNTLIKEIMTDARKGVLA